MPGFFGVFDPTGGNIRKDLRDISSCLSREPDENPCEWSVASDFCGLGLFGKQRLLNKDEDDTSILILDGEFFTETDFSDQRLETKPSRILRIILKEQQISRLAPLNGAFSFAYYDKTKSRITLGTDRFGTYPIFYSFVNGNFAFCSELKGLLAIPWIPKKENFAAFAEFLTLGHFLGDHTYFENIKRLPPGSTLTFEKTNLEITPYWTPKFVPDSKMSKKEHLKQLHQTFSTSVHRRLQGRTGMLLSGGIDSRVIASVLPKDQNISALTYGTPDSWDMVFGKKVAEHIPVTLSTLLLDHTIMPDSKKALHHLLAKQEGFPGLLGSYLEAVYTRAAQDADFILEGVGGEITRRSVYRRFAFFHKNDKDFRQAFVQSLNGLCRYKDFFEPDFYHTLTAYFRESIQNAIDEIDLNYDVDDFLDCFYLRHRVGNLYCMGNNYEKHYIRCRLPFFDYQFIDSLLTTPSKMRRNQEIPRYIVQRANKKLCKIPLDRGALPLPFNNRLLVTGYYQLRERTIRIGSRFFPTLSLLSKYKPFTNYQKWMKDEWQDSIRTILNDPSWFKEAYYNKNRILEYAECFFNGQENDVSILSNLFSIDFIYRTKLQ